MKCATTCGGLFLVLFLSSPSLAQRLPESDSRLERGLVALTELESEFDQLKRVVENNATERLLDDFGNFMFSLVNLAQLLKIHPETALSKAVKIFEKRFRKITEEDPRV